jgi:TPR repeat protein
MYNLGLLLANQWDHPPELDRARIWWERAADAGTTSAMYNLALLLANRWDPPQLGPGPHLVPEGRKEGPPHGTSAPGVAGFIAVMRRIDSARPAAQ